MHNESSSRVMNAITFLFLSQCLSNFNEFWAHFCFFISEQIISKKFKRLYKAINDWLSMTFTSWKYESSWTQQDKKLSLVWITTLLYLRWKLFIALEHSASLYQNLEASATTLISYFLWVVWTKTKFTKGILWEKGRHWEYKTWTSTKAWQ